MDDLDETQWTDAARQTYRTAVATAVNALQEHARLVDTRTGLQSELPGYLASSAHLENALDELADAEFDLTGSFPFFLTDDDAEGDDEPAGDDASAGQTWLHVDYEAQFRITDRDGLLTAGREAYREAWPDDSQDEANQAVSTPEEAVGELLHRHGVAILDRETTYLEPDWHQVALLETTEELTPDDEDDE